MKIQGEFKLDMANMVRLFGEPSEDGTYLVDVNGRQVKMYKKGSDNWTVEAENYRIYARILTLIQKENG